MLELPFKWLKMLERRSLAIAGILFDRREQVGVRARGMGKKAENGISSRGRHRV
jgi:hypothetical protein